MNDGFLFDEKCDNQIDREKIENKFCSLKKARTFALPNRKSEVKSGGKASSLDSIYKNILQKFFGLIKKRFGRIEFMF